MTKRTVIIDVGWGPDVRATSGHMYVQRYYPGPDGTTYIHAAPEQVVLAAEPPEVDLTAGQFFTFTPVVPRGIQITAFIPDGADPLLYKDLIPVDTETLQPLPDLDPAWAILGQLVAEVQEIAGEATAVADAAQADIDSHEADQNNPHAVTKAQVGLGNVNNTADANKPISTATQVALDAITAAVNGEPALRDSAIAAAIANLVHSAPGTLDTLKELADALGDDPNFATTVTNALAGKQPIATLQAAITAFVSSGGAFDLALAAKIAAAIDAVTTSDIIATSTAGALVRGKWTRVDATAGTKAMALANATAARQVTIVEKSDSSANAVTISLGLRGSAGSLTLDSQFQTVVLVADDDLNWYVQSMHRTKASFDAGYANIDQAKWKDALGATTTQPVLRFTAGGGGQGLTSDNVNFFTGKDNGPGVNGTVYKLNPTTGAILATWAGPAHGTEGDYRANRDTLLWAGGDAVAQATVWEIDKSTGAKIRQWDFGTVDYGTVQGCTACWDDTVPAGDIIYLLTADISNNFIIRSIQIKDDGTYVAGAVIATGNVGVIQGMACRAGSVFVYSDDPYTARNHLHRITRWSPTTSGTWIKDRTYALFSGNESEGMAFHQGAMYVGDLALKVYRLDFQPWHDRLITEFLDVTPTSNLIGEVVARFLNMTGHTGIAIDSDTDAYVALQNAGATKWDIRNAHSVGDYLQLRTQSDNVPRVTVRPNGQVGIGGSPTFAQLESITSTTPGASGTQLLGLFSPSAKWGISVGPETISNLYVGAIDNTALSRWFWRASYSDTTIAANTFKPASLTTAGMDALEATLNSGATGDYFKATANAGTRGRIFVIKGSGKVGIGNEAPVSKLQVDGGDIEAGTVGNGVVIKSPDGTRYRITVSNAGVLGTVAI